MPLTTFPPSRSSVPNTLNPDDALSPADRYQELFIAVQSSAVFEDSKTFVDCAPRSAPEDILAAYRAGRDDAAFDLKAFVLQHFDPHQPARCPDMARAGLPMADHIDELWNVFTRVPSQHPPRCSLLGLPHPYVVPGGRFVEMYYWDSYFTMLGLVVSGRQDLLHDMTANFAYLIDTFGHVPNGTRSYYLSRSQPPVFSLMVALCESCGGQEATHYLPQLVREHGFWMAGAQGLSPGQAHRRVVALPDGMLLNRYWDDRDTPREESWREDVATAKQSGRPAAEVYRDLRAAAESGWDFSSRWLDEPTVTEDRLDALSSIRTTRILPVDLNALLHQLETTITRLSTQIGDDATALTFSRHAQRRQDAMNRYLWNAEAGAFLDHDWERAQPRHGPNAATVTPLFTRTVTQAQADAVAATLQSRLLAPGGLSTTVVASGEQWDRPNGWAPLQWMAVEGLRAYGHHDLADTIRDRWLRVVQALYDRDGKLVEKYALRDAAGSAPLGGGGGEYPLQDGFGWTNGVVRQWLCETQATR